MSIWENQALTHCLPVKEWTEAAEAVLVNNAGRIDYDGGAWFIFDAVERQVLPGEYIYTLQDGSLLRYFDWRVTAPTVQREASNGK